MTAPEDAIATLPRSRREAARQAYEHVSRTRPTALALAYFENRVLPGFRLDKFVLRNEYGFFWTGECWSAIKAEAKPLNDAMLRRELQHPLLQRDPAAFERAPT